ncbi:MAG: hypothetical protein O2913_02025, partial [Chloroflexi bacterium]|nr:hypothetical protein [Chloroflexota bacterium]
MNTKIGTSFGLALLMAIGVIATMLVLGMFSAKPVSADTPAATVTVTPDKARSIAQYTVLVTGGAQGALNVGDTITVTFNTSTGVPSSIAASAVKIKANNVGTGTGNQLVNVAGVTISGKAVTLTVPDMDPGTSGGSIGDNGIDASAGITITFTQAAGIQNPNLAKATYTLTVATTADATAVTSSAYTINSFVSFTPSTAARGATVTVTGGGFEKDCTTCKVYFNGDQVTAPTTGAFGSGSIDANGVFSGTVTLSSSTSAGGHVWVTDSTGADKASTTKFAQLAGATPRAATVSPGGSVSVDLVDFTPAAVMGTSAVTVGGQITAPTNTALTVPSTGDTTALVPFVFVMPKDTIAGSHKVTIADSAKSASFTMEVLTRVITVTPATASPGQSITIQGTGFTKSGTITCGNTGTGKLTAASTDGGTVAINHLGKCTTNIAIDASGAWAYVTTLPTLELFTNTVSDAVTIAVTDSSDLTGATSSGAFARTPRTLIVSPAKGGPGTTLTVSVTGMGVDTGEVA